MTLSPAQLGFVRTLGSIVSWSVLSVVISYFADPSHLVGVFPAGVSLVIVTLAGSFEHYLEAQGKGALFGAVNR